MDPEKLKTLQIKPEAKARSQRPLWIIFLGVVLVTGVLISFAWPRAERRLFHRTQDRPAPQPGSATNAAGATNGAVLTISGYIVNHERIEISPRFLGVVKWIGVKKGDAVTNGQVVVLLDDAEQKARLHEADGRVANASAAVEKATLDYARVQKLIADNIETRQAADDARIRLESTRAELKQAEAARELAQTYLDWTVIRSPINGVVLEKLTEAGELVTPQTFGGTRGPSTAVLAVADPNDLQVEIDVNESDLPKIFLGQECRVSPEAYPDKAYAGYVAEIAPEANRQKGTLQLKVQVRDPDRFLTPELSAKVDFLPKS